MEVDVNYIFGGPKRNTCRVCLSTESNLYYRLLDCGLHNDFRNITGIKISPDDGLPQHICCVCRAFLRKAAAFRNKSLCTQNTLSLGHVTINNQNTVTSPLIRYTQTDALLISIPPAETADDIEKSDLVDDKTVVKEENGENCERNVKVDIENFVKAEVNEHSFDDANDFGMDVEEAVSDVAEKYNSKSDRNKVKRKEVKVTKVADRKSKPKAKVKALKNKKFPELNKGDPEMDAQSVKDYLLRTNTANVYAEMLHTYIISKYIDRTKQSNTNIDEENNDCDLMDSDDESTPLNKLIKVEDDFVEISNVLTSQTDAVPSKKILFEFMKERYMEKKVPDKKRRARDLVRIKFKKDGRVVQSQKAMEELRKKCNMEVKMLTLEEQIADVRNRAKTQIYENSLFKCDECFRGFQFEKTYNYHMRSHDPAISGNVKCEVCNKRFVNRRKLKRHQLDHKFRYICKECGRVSRNLHVAKEHAHTHTGQNYQCEYCFRVFSKSASRINHIRIKHGSLQCDICYDLMAPAGLRMHNILRHKETFKCRSCDKVFNDADALSWHTNNTANGVCDLSERPCTKCGEGFATESAWMSHVLEHRKNRKRMERAKYYPSHRNDSTDPRRGRRSKGKRDGAVEIARTAMCEMCGDMFISQAAMRYHQRIHTGEKPYACTYCPKRFRLKTLLTMHINTHTGERPHKCQTCPKAFRSQTALYRHQLVHTKERPHRCTYCDKSFQTSTTVKMHIKTVHLKIPMPPRVRNRKKRAE